MLGQNGSPQHKKRNKEYFSRFIKQFKALQLKRFAIKQYVGVSDNIRNIYGIPQNTNMCVFITPQVADTIPDLK